MRASIDTGGTFTDFVYLENGILKYKKVFSTPKDPSKAILEVLYQVNKNLDVLIHGSTVGTNAFLERKGAKIAFITTSGFEDLLFIGRQARPKLYDFFVEKPRPFVFRENCYGVKERISAKGEIIRPLKTSEIKRILKRLKENPVDSVAVCFINSYLNPVHELKIKKELSLLGIPISISFEVLPEFREFERASTTAINAYLLPVMGNYLKKLKKGLPEVKLYIQQSNGGWMTVEEAEKFASHTILSGPAGGVSGAFILAKIFNKSKVISFDMGGTSTDVCLIDERIPFTKEYILDGFPLSIPVIDIHTVGAGGGSIAYVDVGGVLKVGPESAGADPGPACYGKSLIPTVTDANLVLGRLLPDAFLGGKFKLRKERALKAISLLSQKLGLSVEETALGIIRIANTIMSRALRRVSIERGHNPKDFALICFGGAGGLHACSLSKELGIKEIIIPKFAGTFSAFGLLFSPPLKDFSQTVWLEAKENKKLLNEIERLKNSALSYMKNLGFELDNLLFEVFLDMRYKGQGFELTIPYSEDYIEAFEKEHEKQFGYKVSQFPIEVVTLRVRVKGKLFEDNWRIEKEENFYPPFRTKIFTEKGWIEVPVIDWNSLKIGEELKGPALIVEKFTTLWVEEDFQVKVDDNYTLRLLDYESDRVRNF